MSTAKRKYEAISHMDSETQDQMVMDQLTEVRYIAKRIHDRLPQHIVLDDLIHVGVLGLIEAVHKYDPSRNVQFKSFAKHRIRGAILDSLRELDWSPRDLRQKARQIEKADRKLRNQLGRCASQAELAAEMGYSPQDFQHLLGELRGLNLASLQDQRGENGEDTFLSSDQSNGSVEDPFSLCYRSEMKELLARATGELPPQERQVLALYYYEELTMKEVGAVMGLSESRICQIHTVAMVRLRSRMKELLQGQSMPRTADDRLEEEVFEEAHRRP